MFNYQGLDEQQVLEGVRKFGPAQGAQKIIDWEYKHAEWSVQNKLYITYTNGQKNSECSRVGQYSKCFCSHSFADHELKLGKKLINNCLQCPCKGFRWIPIRPEECGMWWLTRRKDFNVATWKPPCKCKHTNVEHDPVKMKCKACSCSYFQSYFACISCDGAWEDHETLYETEMERIQGKKKIGQQYLPLSENKVIQQEVFQNEKKYKMIDHNHNMIDQFEQNVDQQIQKFEYKHPTKDNDVVKFEWQPVNGVVKPKGSYTRKR